ncbi:hypothetical protein EQ811_08450 [Staphylococcus capitis]|uniref:Uncharacterized protein n=1 Tax=Staphylococcus capitis TaxID=29388 RepID=A0A7Z7YV41_STACP|nr:hypothetical protein [Staphylococcus aureus]QOX59744.1 hypothetical protein FRG19_01005 [Staphylococcus capitis]TQC53313.1 hypothetical protein EKV43_09685 [Staphylococcus sp. SKL71187]TQC61749.1 hypothetical protein EKV48_00875 [Staphylococcus sp. SKL70935]TQC72454.1 hypothetical protein EKV42_02425 [Staphylococcus sp. SKL71207]
MRDVVVPLLLPDVDDDVRFVVVVDFVALVVVVDFLDVDDVLEVLAVGLVDVDFTADVDFGRVVTDLVVVVLPVEVVGALDTVTEVLLLVACLVGAFVTTGFILLVDCLVGTTFLVV